MSSQLNDIAKVILTPSINLIHRFNDIVQQMQQGSLPSPLLMQLQNERHFGCSMQQTMYAILKKDTFNIYLISIKSK